MEIPGPPSTNDGREGRLAVGLAVVFAGIAALAAADLLSDVGEGASLRHSLTEGGLLALGLAGLGLVLARYVGLRRRAKALEDEAEALAGRLEATQADAARWRAEARAHVEGLGAEIDRQLGRWGLSPAEKEVALLLLKGLSHKEVAEARGIGEATARQQARAVYKKAGLAGRADLAAFFLEELLAPRST